VNCSWWPNFKYCGIQISWYWISLTLLTTAVSTVWSLFGSIQSDQTTIYVPKTFTLFGVLSWCHIRLCYQTTRTVNTAMDTVHWKIRIYALYLHSPWQQGEIQLLSLIWGEAENVYSCIRLINNEEGWKKFEHVLWILTWCIRM